MPFNHHSHSGQFCGHATSTLSEILEQAQKRRFRVFACTEHIPRSRAAFYPTETIAETEETLRTKFNNYIKEATRLRSTVEAHEMIMNGSEGMRVLVGYESEWIRPEGEFETALNKELGGMIEKGLLDFCVGSVHHVHTHPIDFDAACFQKAVMASAKQSEEGLFEDYFDAQLAMLREIEPAVVGHFDVIRLKAADPNASLKQYAGVWERITRNLEAVKEQSGLLELNTAALRKGLKEPYPCREVCEEWLRIGGKGFVLSDDSHGKAQVGASYKEGVEFLKGLGVKELWYLRRKGFFGGGVDALSVSIEEVEAMDFWKTA